MNAVTDPFIPVDALLMRAPLSVAASLRLCLAIAKLLREQHAQGHTLGTLHPGLLLVDEDAASARLIPIASAPMADVQGLPVDSLPYVAPERTGRMGHPIDARCDLYALGAIGYHALAGRPPFGAPDAAALLHAHLAVSPAPLRVLNPSVPTVLSEIIESLLSKDPAGRYQTAAGLSHDLEHALSELTRTGSVTPFPRGEYDRIGDLAFPRRLYGRDDETNRLVGFVQRAPEQPAKLILVTGDAGVGKSALVAAIRAATVGTDGRFVTGKFDQLQRSPYQAWIEALGELIEAILADPPEQMAIKQRAIQDSLGELARVVVDLIPALGTLLGPQPEVPALPPREAQQRMASAVTSLVEVLNEMTRPLLIFLDDLQWSDAASLHLLGELLSGAQLRGLVLIAAYRDRELPDDSPIHQLIERAAASGTAIERLRLEALHESSVLQMMSDMLGVKDEAARPLAAMIQQKTQGNPFFVAHLLRSIHEQGAISFDLRRRQWTWDLAAVQALDITDNVVDFVAARLRQLPEESQRSLHILACAGRTMTLGLLASVSGVPEESLRPLLQQLASSHIVRVDVRTAALLREREAATAGPPLLVTFGHDRLQAAAYGLYPVEVSQRTHRRIGEALLSLYRAGGKVADLFEAVNQLNIGHVESEATGNDSLADLNSIAGAAARQAGAFREAQRYLEASLRLLPGNSWAREAQRAADAHCDAAEAAYLVGDHQRMDQLLAVSLENICDPVQRARYLNIRARALIDRNELDQLPALLLDTLLSLGVKLPRKPGMHHLLPALLRTRFKLRRLSTQKLLSLPESTDRSDLAARELISACLAALYRNGRSELHLLLILTLVNMNVDRGYTAIVPQAYATYALVLVVAIGDFDEARRFADIALKLSERAEYRISKAKTRVVVYDFLEHWSRPLRDSFGPMVQTQLEARKLGDREYAGYAAAVRVFVQYMTGTALPVVASLCAELTDEFRAYPGMRNMIDLWRGAVLNLTGAAPGDPCVLGGMTSFEEAKAIPILVAEKDTTTLCAFYIVKTMLGYVFERDEVAARNIPLALGTLQGLAGAPHIPYFHFYEALTLLRWPPPTGHRRRRALSRASALCGKFKSWARRAPSNYAHRHELIAGEIDRVRNRAASAVAHYVAAIELAKTHLYPHDEALAYELFAAFHKERGNESEFRSNMVKAFEAYRAWGAEAKLALLKARNPWLAERGDPDSPDSVHLNELDVGVLLQTSQFLSQELELEEFLRKLITVAAQNTGAQRAALVLRDHRGLRLRARVENAGQAVALLDEPLEQASLLAASVVHYTDRTRKPVVIGDVRYDRRFSRDTDLVRPAAISILCVPVISRQEARGLIYLESDVREAFGLKRVKILEALSGQMATSLENAELYTKLDGALRSQIELTTAHQRFVPHQFLEAIGRDNITEVGLGDHVLKDMSVLYSDMRAFTDRMEKLTPAEGISFINRYIHHVESPITEQGGFIDSFAGDAILALFDTTADATVRAGLEMIRAVRSFSRELMASGSAPVRIGIGINSGPLMLGTIGGQNRIKCGVVGDSVNLASRIEGLTKQYGTSLIIGDSTYSRLADPLGFQLRMLGRAQVMGRSRPVTLYEVFDADPEELKTRKTECLGTYQDALARYYARQWPAALQLFEECHLVLPEDKVVASFAERCRQLSRTGAGEDWSGVERVLEK